MIKKTITFKDFNDNERTEDFYFNLTEAELIEMNLSVSGGLDQLVERITSAQDGKEIIKVFKEIILASYGVKSLDGRKFEKSDNIRKDFESTNAYSQIFTELATDDAKAAAFIKGVVSNDLRKKIEEAEKTNPQIKMNNTIENKNN